MPPGVTRCGYITGQAMLLWLKLPTTARWSGTPSSAIFSAMNPAGLPWTAAAMSMWWETARQRGPAPVQPWAGGLDAFVAKLDGNGNLLWHTFMGGTADDYGYWHRRRRQRQCLCVGNQQRRLGHGPVRAYTGGSDTFVAKLDSSGARTLAHLSWRQRRLTGAAISPLTPAAGIYMCPEPAPPAGAAPVRAYAQEKTRLWQN